MQPRNSVLCAHVQMPVCWQNSSVDSGIDPNLGGYETEAFFQQICWGSILFDFRVSSAKKSYGEINRKFKDFRPKKSDCERRYANNEINDGIIIVYFCLAA